MGGNTEFSGTKDYNNFIFSTDSGDISRVQDSLFNGITPRGVYLYQAPAGATIPTIDSQPQDVICNVGDSKTISVTASSSDGGTLLYQWYSNTIDSNTGGTEIIGATNASYTVPTSTADTYYLYCIVTNTNNIATTNKIAMAISDVATVTINSIKYYTVTFNSEGGSAVAQITDVLYGAKITKPTDPAKTGYSFAGWYKDSGLTTIWDFETDTIPANNITLYAKWIPAQDSITMVASSNSVKTSDSFNQVFTLNINNDTVIGEVYRSDISLSGVFSSLSLAEVNNNETTVTAEVYGNLSSVGTGIITINDDKLSNRTSQLSATVTVTSKPTYTVSYNSNGATSGSIPTDNNSYEQGDSAIVKDNIGNLNKTGYKFIGWNTKTYGTGVDYAKGDTIIVENSNIELYANWVVEEYIVTFKDYNGNELKVGTVAHGHAATAPVAPSRAGYAFSGWNVDYSNVTENLTVTAQYNVNHYTISFESNGGSTVNNKIINYNTKVDKPNNPTRAGYSFQGWYEDEALTSSFDFDTLIVEDKTLYAKWQQINSGGSSSGSSSNSNSESSNDRNDSNAQKENTIVIVNGQEEKAGKESITEKSGEKTVEVKIDSDVIDAKIEEVIRSQSQDMGEIQSENIIKVPILTKEAKKMTTILTGDIVKKMDENNFNLSIVSEAINYVIPLKEVGIENVAKSLEVEANKLKEIELKVIINKVDEKITKEIEERAKGKDYEIVFPPVSFEVVAKIKIPTGEEKQVTVSKFNQYVQRVIRLPEGVDPSKITTGIVYNKDGTFSHVPTCVFMKDGIYYAKINSLTNSSYSVIWNPVIVKSVENHWSKEAVNDMASRLVVKDPEIFMPDQDITRGEFAEYITKALGIYRTGVANIQKFSDVEKSHELTDAIQIASEYGIIRGYPDGSFKPSTKISREEAMVMYSRTMDIVGLEEVDNNRIEIYIDKDMVADWAYNDVKKTVSAGVFNGKTKETISPKDTFTFAEAAIAVRNLLIASGLINN